MKILLRSMRFIPVIIMLLLAVAQADVASCVKLLNEPLSAAQLSFYKKELQTLRLNSKGYAKITLDGLLGAKNAAVFLKKLQGKSPKLTDPMIKALSSKISEVIEGALAPDEVELDLARVEVRDQPDGAFLGYLTTEGDFNSIGKLHVDTVALRAIYHLFGPSVEFQTEDGTLETLKPGEILVFSGKQRIDPQTMLYFDSPTYHKAPSNRDEARRFIVMTWRYTGLGGQPPLDSTKLVSKINKLKNKIKK